MVAVVVPSPALSEVWEATSRTICAPMFSNLGSTSISFATVTPSLVMSRGAVALLDDDVPALRAERHRDRLGERLDAAEDGLAGDLVECDLLGSHLELLSRIKSENGDVEGRRALAVAPGGR